MTTRPIDQTGTRYQENVAGVEVVDVYKSRPFSSMIWGEVSLGAIFCGVIIALIVHLAMNMLGLSIGASTVNPVTEVNPVEQGLGAAAVMWVAFSTLLALFLGGWVAGRLSNTNNHVNSTLHGVITWALTWIILLAFIGSSIGGLISGLGSIFTQGASILTSGAASAAPALLDNVSIEGQTLESFVGEFDTLLAPPQTGTSETSASPTGSSDATQAQNTMSESQPMTMADLSLSRDVTGFVTSVDMDEANRQDLAVQLSDRTSLTEAEAAAQLDMWRNTYQGVREQAVQTARRVGQAASDTLTVVAGSLFAILLASAIVAGLGAYLGGSWQKETLLSLNSKNAKVVA